MIWVILFAVALSYLIARMLWWYGRERRLRNKVVWTDVKHYKDIHRWPIAQSHYRDGGCPCKPKRVTMDTGGVMFVHKVRKDKK